MNSFTTKDLCLLSENADQKANNKSKINKKLKILLKTNYGFRIQSGKLI